MTTYNRTTLKGFFEQGDVPTGTDYANLIDSCVNMVETGVQTLGGALNPTELIAGRVSAGTGVFTGTMTITGITSVGTLYADQINAASIGAITTSALTVNGDITASSGKIIASAANISNKLTAGAGSFAGLVSADAGLVVNNGLFLSTGIVSAAGTTQGAAAVLAFGINRGKGIADGATTGFTPPANNAGRIQYLFNEGASANLWPPAGGTINGLAANAVFPLAASAMVTIVHLTASAMAVK